MPAKCDKCEGINPPQGGVTAGVLYVGVETLIWDTNLVAWLLNNQ